MNRLKKCSNIDQIHCKLYESSVPSPSPKLNSSLVGPPTGGVSFLDAFILEQFVW